MVIYIFHEIVQNYGLIHLKKIISIVLSLLLLTLSSSVLAEEGGASLAKARSGSAIAQSDNTVNQTLELFHQGQEIAQIAESRELSEQTVSHHLSLAIASQALELDQVIRIDTEQPEFSANHDVHVDCVAGGAHPRRSPGLCVGTNGHRIP